MCLLWRSRCNAQPMRMLGALDGVTRRPALGASALLQPRRVCKLPPRIAERGRDLAACRSLAGARQGASHLKAGPHSNTKSRRNLLDLRAPLFDSVTSGCSRQQSRFAIFGRCCLFITADLSLRRRHERLQQVTADNQFFRPNQ